MKLIFIGADHEVTGSCHVVEVNGRYIMLDCGLEQGKDLFAVPGDINRQTSQGCNRLIMSGANPYLGVEDFIKYLLPNTRTRSKQAKKAQISLFADNEEERAILNLLSEDIRDGDIIMEKLQMNVATFNQTITMLEIKGVIRSLGANCWTLN